MALIVVDFPRPSGPTTRTRGRTAGAWGSFVSSNWRVTSTRITQSRVGCTAGFYSTSLTLREWLGKVFKFKTLQLLQQLVYSSSQAVKVITAVIVVIGWQEFKPVDVR